MPPLLRGPRRLLMALLVATSIAHTACAIGAGLLVGVLLRDAGRPAREVGVDVAVLLGALVGLGATCLLYTSPSPRD